MPGHLAHYNYNRKELCTEGTPTPNRKWNKHLKLTSKSPTLLCGKKWTGKVNLGEWSSCKILRRGKEGDTFNSSTQEPKALVSVREFKASLACSRTGRMAGLYREILS